MTPKHDSVWHRVMRTADADTLCEHLFSEVDVNTSLRKQITGQQQQISDLQSENDTLRRELHHALDQQQAERKRAEQSYRQYRYALDLAAEAQEDEEYWKKAAEETETEIERYRYELTKTIHASPAVNGDYVCVPTHKLESLIAPFSCGCVPCRGDCRSAAALEFHIEGIQDEVRELLSDGGHDAEAAHEAGYAQGWNAAEQATKARAIEDATEYVMGTMSKRIAELERELKQARAEVDRCHDRLEINYVYAVDIEFGAAPGESHVQLQRRDIPYEERQDMPDAVYCRDLTIRQLEEDYHNLKNVIVGVLDGDRTAYAAARELTFHDTEKEG